MNYIVLVTGKKGLKGIAYFVGAENENRAKEIAINSYLSENPSKSGFASEEKSHKRLLNKYTTVEIA